ncbi:MAG: CDP-alcohol phosphatidyltransferase family protein [Candidatus Omnitrophica bacterium]|nr:CDP-alcohol phosphatidyltransferase family protein [Candidatus Omnitrophota bacterium]
MALTFANKITVCRILAVPFFIATVLYYTPQNDYLRLVALGIFLFAVISDAVDGYVARHYRQRTKAGAVLDPVADKLLLISAFICLYKVGAVVGGGVRFPVWLVVGVISRDVILLAGAAIIRLFHSVEHGDFNLEPTVWGKATTFFQVLSVLGILLRWPVFCVFWYPMIVLTVVSGVDYIRKGIKIINNGVVS